jgi:transmembrane sensor
MMAPSEADSRLERVGEEAREWVAKILDDPKAHAAGLRAWVGTDQERADAYNAVYRKSAEGGARGRQLYGLLAVRQHNRAVAQIRTLPFGRLVGITAALTIFGLACNLGISALSGHLSQASSIDAQAAVATQIGEIRTVSLPDGSRVTLDTGSSIRVAYTDRERRVDLLAGRARFDVVHNGRVPFRLVARGMTVTDRGTVFDVDVTHDPAVRLIEGAADVSTASNARMAAPRVVHLVRGQTVRFAPVPKASDRPIPAQWVNGRQTFDDVPASDVVAEANRYSNVRIEVADPAAGAQKVFLDVDVRNPHSVAAQLASVLKLEVDESEPGRIVLR